MAQGICASGRATWIVERSSPRGEKRRTAVRTRTILDGGGTLRMESAFANWN
jgi:hypothetical protein